MVQYNAGIYMHCPRIIEALPVLGTLAEKAAAAAASARLNAHELFKRGEGKATAADVTGKASTGDNDSTLELALARPSGMAAIQCWICARPA